MKLKGKKVVLLAENNYEDLELWVPYFQKPDDLPAFCRELIEALAK